MMRSSDLQATVSHVTHSLTPSLNAMTYSFFKRRIFVLIAGLLLSIIFGGQLGITNNMAFAQGGDQPDPTGKAYRGKTLFSQRCAQCHGEQGKGDGPLAEQLTNKPPDFTAPSYAAEMSPQDIFDIIANGRMDKMMPPWKNELSEDEIWDAAAYVWSLHLTPDEIDQAGQLYEQKCSQCHGSSGAGVKDDVPDLANNNWLQATNTQLIAAITQEKHPDIGVLSEQEQQLAAIASRRFSFGFAQNEVLIEGLGDAEVLVQDGTNGKHLANQPVRLIIFEQEQFAELRKGQTDDQGNARFTGLPTTPTWAYVVETTYQDLTYHSDVGHFSPDSNMIQLTVSVYDPGATREAISVDRSHWLVDITNPGFVDMGEVYSFMNSADRVYAGETKSGEDKQRVIEIPLPEDAVNINVEGETLGERFWLDGTTLIDSQPLPPGDTQIFLRYSLPVQKGKVTLSHAIPYPTKMLNLLAPDIGIKIDAPDWQQDAPIQTQGGNFLNYSILDLPAGTTPVAVLSNINENTIADDSQQTPQQVISKNAAPGVSGTPYLPWLVGLLGAFLLGVGVFFAWGRYKHTLAEAPALREEQKNSILRQIAALDDAFEAKEINSNTYYKQRNLLKLQIAAIMREDAKDETQSPPATTHSAEDASAIARKQDDAESSD